MATFARLIAGAVGLAGWSFTEYATHRWALHPTDTPIDVSYQHRQHHRQPAAVHPAARVAGLAAIGGVAAAATSLLSRVLPNDLAVASAATWAAGYAIYDQYHWALHHRAPRTSIGRTLRHRHFRHHFGSPQKNFGVTTALWDRMFGTEAQPEPVRLRAKNVPPWLLNSTDERMRAMLVVDG